MSGIKYYQLKEDEELPDEFCAVKDVNGEPSEYTFYRPETENAKLRDLVRDIHALGWSGFDCTECPVSFSGRCENNGGCNWLGILTDRMRELGIEVDK